MPKKPKQPITDALLKDPKVRELYMAYLGTLAVLGRASTHVRGNVEVVEEIDNAMNGAAVLLKGRIDISRAGRRYIVEVDDG